MPGLIPQAACLSFAFVLVWAVMIRSCLLGSWPLQILIGARFGVEPLLLFKDFIVNESGVRGAGLVGMNTHLSNFV